MWCSGDFRRSGRARGSRRPDRRLTAALTAALILVQSAWGLALPRVALAAPATVVWTERADFESNAAGAGERTTRVGVDTVTSPGDVRLASGVIAIATGSYHILGLKADGTVVAEGAGSDFFSPQKRDTSSWRDITAVAASYGHSVGLRADGTAVAVGDDFRDQCQVGGWSGIVGVSAGWEHTLGLESSGTVVMAGDNLGPWTDIDVSGWTGIAEVASGRYHAAARRLDGTVVASGRNDTNQCNVGTWTDIADIDCGGYHTVGLTDAGTVVATGRNVEGQCNVAGWTGIVAIAADGNQTLGLKADGTVVTTGSNFANQLNVGSWTDIVAIDASWVVSAGLRSDGTIVVAGDPTIATDWVSGLSGAATEGSIGGVTGEVGLRADLSSTAALGSLEASMEPLATGEAVKFGIRLSDDGVTWGPTLGTDGLAIDWTGGTGTYFGRAFGDAVARTDLSALGDARYVEIVVMMEGLAGTSPVLHGVALQYDGDAPVTYDVTFESNGGSDVPTQTVEHGGFATTPTPDPTREGYTFTGWFADPALTDLWDFETDPVTGDTTLYAGWQINSYPVTFVDWNGTVLDTQSVDHGDDAVAPPDPIREGYTFAGWDTDFTNVTGPLTVTALYTKNPIEFIRHAGVDRYDTASIAAIRDFPGGADIAIVATGENFPDALTASGLAGTVSAPILLTRTATLSPACASALAALGVDKVYIVGRERAVSLAVEAALAKRYDIERLGGADRYATAQLIANEAIGLGASRTEAFLAFGGNFPDALGVSSIAAQKQIPVLLTQTANLHGTAAAVISAYGTDNVFIAGGTAVVSPAVASQVAALGASVTRWAGPNRYDTAAAVITNGSVRWGLAATKIGIASGANFPDALAGGAAMGRQQGLLLLSTPSVLSPQTEPIIMARKSTITRVEFFGGLKALSQTVQNRVVQLLR